ncbi:MAG: hypothetical protein LC663_01245 [Actinobacteria bacterium]|nr:hypothetical protein [Actinomycetota bacterium]
MPQGNRDNAWVLDRNDDLGVRGIVRGGRVDERPQPRRGLQQRRSTSRTPGGRTRDELYEEAKALGIPGRSAMDKHQLEEAIDRRRGRR